jgi:hypothetical protein
MPIEGIAPTIPRCAECEAHWLPADEERWQAWLTEDDPTELVFYCPPTPSASSGSRFRLVSGARGRRFASNV